MMLAFVFLTATLAAISVIDWRTRRIPDALSLPLVLGGLVWSLQAGGHGFSAYLAGALVGYASLAAFGWLYFRLRGREGLGLGDAKLFAAAGAWLGWQALPLVLLAASLGGLGYALFARGKRPGRNGSAIAFGPWISVALWLTWTIEWRLGP